MLDSQACGVKLQRVSYEDTGWLTIQANAPVALHEAPSSSGANWGSWMEVGARAPAAARLQNQQHKLNDALSKSPRNFLKWVEMGEMSR